MEEKYVYRRNVVNESYASKTTEDDSASATMVTEKPSGSSEKTMSADQNKMPFNPLLRTASPVVNRSRLSIPCNSRGVVCATSIETPLHVVRGTKPLCRDKKRLHTVTCPPKSAIVGVKDFRTEGDEEPTEVTSGEYLHVTDLEPTSYPTIGPSSSSAHYILDSSHPATSEPSIKAMWRRVHLNKPKLPARVKCSNCARRESVQENPQSILTNKYKTSVKRK